MRTENQYSLWSLSSVSQTAMKKSDAFRNCIITLIASGSANLTIKCYASNQETEPDLSAAASASNQYAEVQITSLNDWTGIDWTTWVVYAWSSDWVTRYEVNDNYNRWIGFKVTARSAWAVDIYIDMCDNQ